MNGNPSHMQGSGTRKADGEGSSRKPQSQAVWGGIALLALAGGALFALSDLDNGSLAALGPGGLPKGAAVFVGLIGLLILGRGLMKAGERIEPFGLRGIVLVLGALLFFAVTIRPFSLGALTTPGLGLLGAGPISIFIAGHATPEARSGELAVLACVLTGFCMVLFGDVLGLPIPMFPTSLDALFSGWLHATILRGIALLLFILGILIFLAGRGLRALSAAAAGTEGAAR